MTTNEKTTDKVLAYDVRRHRAFIRQAEARFLANKKANAVMGGKDPLLKFLRRQPAIRAELNDLEETELPTK